MLGIRGASVLPPKQIRSHRFPVRVWRDEAQKKVRMDTYGGINSLIATEVILHPFRLIGSLLKPHRIKLLTLLCSCCLFPKVFP